MSKEILDNSEDFVIESEEKKDEYEVIDPLDILIDKEFSDEKEDNFEEALEMINIIEKEATAAKNSEAEVVISELAEKYLDEDYKAKLDNHIKNFEDFMKKYNVEKDFMKKKNDKEITKIYTIGTFLLNNIAAEINKLLLNLTITRKEFKFLNTVLVSKLEYDGNDVFNTIEFNELYLKKWREQDKALPKEVEEFMITIDITNIVMLYHLINKHSVKGINEQFYTFANILQKIGETNKLYNAYNVIKTRLDDRFVIWTTATTNINLEKEKELKDKETITAVETK